MTGLEQAFEQIGTAAEHHLTVSHAAGLALAVTDREDVLGVVCRGMADVAARAPVRPETRFQIGSISKSFASLLVLREAEAGRLDLHVSVNEILPWLGLPEPFGPITLHHLMTHMAGIIVGTEDAPTGPGALLRLRGLPATRAPGERFLYSNDGWKVVGACLEEVTGRRVHDLIAERLLEPLEMRSSTGAIRDAVWTDLAVGYQPMYTDRPPQLRHPLLASPRIVSNTADGSIVSNVLDMSAYARLILARGDVADGLGGRIASEEVFGRWVEQRVDDGEGGTYGYGWWQDQQDGLRWIAHSGGMVGYTAFLAVSPDEGLGVAILQNGEGRKRSLARAAFATVRASLAGDELPAPWIPPAPTDVQKAADYEGRYEGDDGRVLEITETEGGLLVSIGSVSIRPERDPLAEPQDVFVMPHDALELHALEFVRDEAGTVVEAFLGSTWFRGERYQGPEPDAIPEGWHRYVGLYRNDDPWAPTLRIVIRKGRLVLRLPAAVTDDDGGGTLVPLGDDAFAVGSEDEPSRLRFIGAGAGGLAVIAELDGGSWFRSFED